MPNENGNAALRYDTVIVTLIGICALAVSAYTAYMQRQQVRAAVWPILEYSTSNEPTLRFIVENKGVGPAIIRNVIVRVDGEPVHAWDQALQKLVGPGNYNYTQSTISGHTFSAGESLTVFIPKNSDGTPLSGEKSGPLATTLDRERGRVAVEICYSSTLGECWTLRSGGNSRSSTTETRTCPDRSADSFEE